MEAALPARTCCSLEDFEAAGEACATGELPHDAIIDVLREVVLNAAPAAADADARLAEDEEIIRTTAGRILFFLLVHRAFRPNPQPEAELLEALDGVPLVTTP